MVTIAIVGALGASLGCGDARRHDRGVALPARPEPAVPRLRVLSYNVNFGIPGDPSTIAAIAAVDAELVFLQETNLAWQGALDRALADRYPHRRFTPPKAWPAGGLGVLSRAPIETLDVVANPVGPFFAHRVVLDTTLGRIQVLSVHLRPPMSDGGSWVVGYFSTREVRRSELAHLLEALEPALPTLIVGDFNEEADGLAVGWLGELGYHDALAEHVGGAPTWSWPVGSVTLRFQLDHLFHSAHFIAVTAKVVDAGRSDHRPVWTDLERQDP